MPTRVIVFSAPHEKEVHRLFEEVATCSRRVSPEAHTFFHRGCAELYHDLFGDSMSWTQTETIRKPEAVGVILGRIRKMLFWEREE
jgi:hypothetical protein